MSFLIDAATEIASALDDHTFSIDPLSIDYDYEGRLKDSELSSEDVQVRVIVPRTYHAALRHTQNDKLYVAAFDIDIRKKLGPVAQGASAPAIPKSELENLTALAEEIHEYFWDNEPTLGGGKAIEWVSERDDLGVESKILVAYSVKYIREQRQFYAVCREFFMQIQKDSE